MKRIILLGILLGIVTGFGIIAAVSQAHYYDGCQKDRCKSHVIAPYQAQLKKMAICESGRRWNYSGPGYYDGGLQFDPRTWSSLGSPWDYAYQAPAREQKYRAVILYHRIGCWRCTAGWPNCG